MLNKYKVISAVLAIGGTVAIAAQLVAAESLEASVRFEKDGKETCVACEVSNYGDSRTAVGGIRVSWTLRDDPSFGFGGADPGNRSRLWDGTVFKLLEPSPKAVLARGRVLDSSVAQDTFLVPEDDPLLYWLHERKISSDRRSKNADKITGEITIELDCSVLCANAVSHKMEVGSRTFQAKVRFSDSGWGRWIDLHKATTLEANTERKGKSNATDSGKGRRRGMNKVTGLKKMSSQDRNANDHPNKSPEPPGNGGPDKQK
jgi:hypothetical protein